jgi:hypothetical protein
MTTDGEIRRALNERYRVIKEAISLYTKRGIRLILIDTVMRGLTNMSDDLISIIQPQQILLY